jgi:hypothetical protein
MAIPPTNVAIIAANHFCIGISQDVRSPRESRTYREYAPRMHIAMIGLSPNDEGAAAERIVYPPGASDPLQSH